MNIQANSDTQSLMKFSSSKIISKIEFEINFKINNSSKVINKNNLNENSLFQNESTFKKNSSAQQLFYFNPKSLIQNEKIKLKLCKKKSNDSISTSNQTPHESFKFIKSEESEVKILEFSKEDVQKIIENHYKQLEEEEESITYLENSLILIKALEPFFVSPAYQNKLIETMQYFVKNLDKIIVNTSINFKNDILVLDMDETLLHIDYPPKFNCIYDKLVNTNEGSILGISIRPGLIEFLNDVSQYYDLVLYSAGSRNYVEQAISAIKINNSFSMVLCNNETLNISDEIFLKDLRLIKFLDYLRSSNYYFQDHNQLNTNSFSEQKEDFNNIISIIKLFAQDEKSTEFYENSQIEGINFKYEKEVIIADNNIYSFCLNLDCGILLEDYYYNKEDCELERLGRFLKDIYFEKIKNGTLLKIQIQENFNYKIC